MSYSLGWKKEGKIPLNTDGLVSFAYGDFIYIAGGEHGTNFNVSATVTSSVYRAPINGDKIGAWSLIGNLPAPNYIQGQLCVQYSNYVYIVGGADSAYNDILTIQIGNITPDGNIIWRKDPLPLPISGGFSIACTTVDNILYVVGNRHTHSQPGTNVFSSKINTDGSLSSWNIQPTFPNVNGISSGFLFSDGSNLIYGGGSTSIPTPVFKIWKSRINNDGTLSAWINFGSLKASHGLGAFAISEDGIICLVSGTDSDYTGAYATVETFSANSIGNIIYPSTQSPYPLSVTNPYSTIFNGRIYVFGGADPSANIKSDIYSALVQSNGVI